MSRELWTVPPRSDGPMQSVPGAKWEYYAGNAWSVYSIPPEVIERVKKLNGRPYMLGCGCLATVVTDTGSHQEGCSLA